MFKLKMYPDLPSPLYCLSWLVIVTKKYGFVKIKPLFAKENLKT
jgi:hypothetical protein